MSNLEDKITSLITSLESINTVLKQNSVRIGGLETKFERLISLEAKFNSLSENLGQVLKIVRDGNGKIPLTTKVELIDNNIEDIRSELSEIKKNNNVKFKDTEDKIQKETSILLSNIEEVKKSIKDISNEKRGMTTENIKGKWAFWGTVIAASIAAIGSVIAIILKGI